MKIIKICMFIIAVSILVLIKINQLHIVSRTEQGRQREPSVKTLSTDFWRFAGGGKLRLIVY